MRKDPGKLRHSLGARIETSPPDVRSALPGDSAQGTGTRVSCVRATVATSSRAEERQFAQPVVPSPSSPPSFPQGQGQRRRPPSPPPLWCLQPGGGSDPQQLTQHRHCLSHSPQDTPWAQRRVCSTAATTQAAAPATLNCLPDRRDHCPSPRKVVATHGRRVSGLQIHLRDRLKLRQQLWRAPGGGRRRGGKDGGCTSHPGPPCGKEGAGSPLKMAAAATRLRTEPLRRRAPAGGK